MDRTRRLVILHVCDRGYTTLSRPGAESRDEPHEIGCVGRSVSLDDHGSVCVPREARRAETERFTHGLQCTPADEGASRARAGDRGIMCSGNPARRACGGSPPRPSKVTGAGRCGRRYTKCCAHQTSRYAMPVENTIENNSTSMSGAHGSILVNSSQNVTILRDTV
jgi:hypothetical protein